MTANLPETGFIRLPVILAHFPVSRSTWWSGCKTGRFPAPVKLTERTTAWRAEDIHALIKKVGAKAG
jgi:predicted DNA-binding transcriptional regulator AlpA